MCTRFSSTILLLGIDPKEIILDIHNTLADKDFQKVIPFIYANEESETNEIATCVGFGM